MKKRIDILLVEKGLTRSRTLAAELIRAGKVFIDGVVVEKPSLVVPPDVQIEIKEKPLYVGRGGLKIEHALETFNVDVSGRVIVDIGASTGGFTDCVLKRGAKKVYAIDVGKGQLVPEIRNNPNVVPMEETDVRTVALPERADLAVVDVSFISATKILPNVASFLKKDGDAIVLIKPQFEVGKGKLGKNGVVKDEALQKKAIETVITKAEEIGLSLEAVTDSPILGGSGNKEYLALFKKTSH